MGCTEIQWMSERDLGIDGLFEFLVPPLFKGFLNGCSAKLIVFTVFNSYFLYQILSNNGVMKIRKVCIFVY